MITAKPKKEQEMRMSFFHLPKSVIKIMKEPTKGKVKHQCNNNRFQKEQGTTQICTTLFNTHLLTDLFATHNQDIFLKAAYHNNNNFEKQNFKFGKKLNFNS